jgi:hypothetical protein
MPASNPLRSLASLSLLGLLLAACGDDPGGTVGASCDSIGNAGECETNEVCDSVSGFSAEAYCLRICDEQADCDQGENCNGVSGSSLKACHPKDGDDEDVDDGDDEDSKKNGG